MTREELQAIADNARAWTIKARGTDNKSDAAHMVLGLMDTEEYDNNYCAALREVLAAFPKIDRDELETELNKYI